MEKNATKVKIWQECQEKSNNEIFDKSEYGRWTQKYGKWRNEASMRVVLPSEAI